MKFSYLGDVKSNQRSDMCAALLGVHRQVEKATFMHEILDVSHFPPLVAEVCTLSTLLRIRLRIPLLASCVGAWHLHANMWRPVGRPEQ